MLDGQSACPPKDCGGTHGYQSALETLKDPDSPAAKDCLRWAGEDFDPERFDRRAANAALARLAWNRWITPPHSDR